MFGTIQYTFFIEEFDFIVNVKSTFQDVLVGVESGVHQPPGVTVGVQFRTNGAQTLVEQEKTGHLKKGIFTVCTQLKNEDLVGRTRPGTEGVWTSNAGSRNLVSTL